MAIATNFIDFIVPKRVIEEKYPGGWAQCLQDHAKLIGGRVWYDDHLFRDGAMNPADIGALIEEWTAKGFECISEKDGKRYWKDVCVYEGMFGGATLPCDWLGDDQKNRSVFLKGAPLCELSGPNLS